MSALDGRMPALYLSHGAPPLADDPVWPGQLAAWAAGCSYGCQAAGASSV